MLQSCGQRWLLRRLDPLTGLIPQAFFSRKREEVRIIRLISCNEQSFFVILDSLTLIYKPAVMKYVKLSLLFLVIVAVTSCGPKEKGVIKQVIEKVQEKPATILPLDKGFSEYIAGYTSGIIPANSVIENTVHTGVCCKSKKGDCRYFYF
jgi:hypothetical protein